MIELNVNPPYEQKVALIYQIALKIINAFVL
jgi:hypothetical protein